MASKTDLKRDLASAKRNLKNFRLAYASVYHDEKEIVDTIASLEKQLGLVSQETKSKK